MTNEVALANLLVESRSGYWGVEKGERDEDVRIVRNGDISAEGTVRWDRLPLRSLSMVEVERSELQAGDLLLTTSGNCGTVAHIEARPIDRTCASNFVRILRFDPQKVESRYMYHLMRSQLFIAGMQPFIRGTTLKNLSLRPALASVYCTIPSLAEQRRIAQKLDRADAVATSRRRSLALTEQLSAATFDDLFGADARASRQWPIVELGSLARIVRGASPRPAGDARYFGGDIPWLKISDVTASQGPVVTEIKEGVTPEGRKRSVLVPAGSLILTNSATVGIPKFLGVDACIHDGFLAFLDIDARIDPTYLYFLLLARRPALIAMAPTGTQANLNTGIVKAMAVPVPPMSVQEDFVHRIAAIGRYRLTARNHLMAIDELVSAVRHQAFRGEL